MSVLVTGRGKSGAVWSYSINLHLLSAEEHAGLAAHPLALLYPRPCDSNPISPSSPPYVCTHWRVTIIITGGLPFTWEDEQRVCGVLGMLIMSHTHAHTHTHGHGHMAEQGLYDWWGWWSVVGHYGQCRVFWALGMTVDMEVGLWLQGLVGGFKKVYKLYCTI